MKQQHPISGTPAADVAALQRRVAELEAANEALRATQQALQHSEARYRRLVEDINDVIFTLDAQGVFTYVSPAIQRVSDYTPGDLVGRPFAEFVFEDDLPQVMQSFQRTLAGQLEPTTFRVRHKSGALRDVRTYSRTLTRGDGSPIVTTGVMTDITDQKRAEQQVVELKNFYEQILNVLPNDVAVFDAEGRIRFVNPCAIRDAEVRAWIIGRTERAYFERRGLDPDLCRYRQSFIQRCIETGERYVFEETLPGRAGEDVHFRRWVSPIKDRAGRVTHVLGWGLEITDQKASEETLRTAQTLLEARVQERTKELEAFAYSVSHDLRAPLRAISGFAQILSNKIRDTLDADERHYVDNIVDASLQMDQLIQDLLAYSRLGRKAVSHRPIALTAVVDQVLRAFEARIAAAGAVITVADDLPVIRSDHTLVRQILFNLIENALTYQAPDATPRVSVAWQWQGPHLEISVADNGVGIDEVYHEKVFRVFQRLHGPEAFPGSGIGLAIVKKCVTLLQGQLRLASAEGQGSTFYVLLPAE